MGEEQLWDEREGDRERGRKDERQAWEDGGDAEFSHFESENGRSITEINHKRQAVRDHLLLRKRQGEDVSTLGCLGIPVGRQLPLAQSDCLNGSSSIWTTNHLSMFTKPAMPLHSDRLGHGAGL